MADPRNHELKKITDSYCFYKRTKDFHRQQVAVEENAFIKANMENRTLSNRQIERLASIQEYRALLNEAMRQMTKLSQTIQKFLDWNPDLKESMLYQKALRLLKVQKDEEEFDHRAKMEAMRLMNLPEVGPEMENTPEVPKNSEHNQEFGYENKAENGQESGDANAKASQDGEIKDEVEIQNN